ANSDSPPRSGLPDWPMYSSAPASGAVMHGPTSKADSTPSNAAPPREPPPPARDARSRRLRSHPGSCNWNTPNMDNASTANSAAKEPSSHGCWSAACRLAPLSPAATPSTAYTAAIGSTEAADRPSARPGVGSPATTSPDPLGLTGREQGANAAEPPTPQSGAAR